MTMDGLKSFRTELCSRIIQGMNTQKEGISLPFLMRSRRTCNNPFFLVPCLRSFQTNAVRLSKMVYVSRFFQPIEVGRHRVTDPLHLAFPDQRPCVSEWHAWQSVIKFSRQSCLNWLLAFKWWWSVAPS